MKRVLVIGDIHGAYRALLQLLERANLQSSDQLIFLGDFVDGWSQSFELVDHLLQLEERQSCIFIKGNHDLWCQQWLDKGLLDETWLYNGGQATFSSYQNRSPEDLQRHRDFFLRTRNYFIDAENRLFIHAGFSSQHGPHKEHYSSNYSWDRTLWEMALSTDPRIPPQSLRFPKRLKLFKEIYIGHTPTLHVAQDEPMNAVNVWNVDTGAGFTGKLSMIEVHTKQVWQSDIVRHLYPDEAGRKW